MRSLFRQIRADSVSNDDRNTSGGSTDTFGDTSGGSTDTFGDTSGGSTDTFGDTSDGRGVYETIETD